jgi:tRNA (Thr-GGU) A37 N-methylase
MPAFQPIGLIRSPFSRREQTPIQPYRSRAAGWVEVLPEYGAGDEDLDGFSHIILLYFFHRAEPGYELAVTPFLDEEPKGCSPRAFPGDRIPSAYRWSALCGARDTCCTWTA